MFKKQFSEVEDACALAQAMVDTVREPLIVLDKDLRVVAAEDALLFVFEACFEMDAVGYPTRRRPIHKNAFLGYRWDPS